jgi:hypothetical protein
MFKTLGRKEMFYAYRIRHSIWNDRRCTVHWTVEGKCLVEEEHAATGAERQSYPRLSVKLATNKISTKKNRCRYGAVLLFFAAACSGGSGG